MDYLSESLKLHYKLRGKLEIQPRAGVSNKDELSLAYTPGVAAACLEIKDDVSKSYDLTRRWNMAAGITDGTAPSKFCTRAQAAAMVARSLGK